MENREIKFRAWHEENEVMINPNIVMSAVQFFNYLEAPFILMQFTGLLDKNGTPVFEGDIVKYGYSNGFSWGTDYFTGKIGFENSCFGIYKNKKFLPFTPESIKKLEKADTWKVIGNIFENKNLLNK